MPTPKPSALFSTLPTTRTASTSSRKSKPPKRMALCPVVPEANGRLKDKVRINGQIEVHPKAPTTSSGGSVVEAAAAIAPPSPATRPSTRPAAKPSSLRAIRDGLIAGPEPEPRLRQDDNRRRHRRLSALREDAAQAAYPSDLPLHARHPAPRFATRRSMSRTRREKMCSTS
jgi:hypothetical protein